MTSPKPTELGRLIQDTAEKLGVLEYRLEAIAQGQDDTSSTVSELSKTVHKLGNQVSGLTDMVTALTNKSEDDDESPPAVTNWRDLSQEKAADAWRSLHSWIDEVLVGIYEVSTSQLPSCWAWHKSVRAELTWLRAAYDQAMESDRGSAVGEWHTRWLPGALDRISKHLDRYGCNVMDENTRRPVGHAHAHGPPPPSTEGTWDMEAWLDDIGGRESENPDSGSGVDS